MRKATAALLGTLVWLLSASSASADKSEAKLDLHPILGPAKISLGDNLATLDLPKDFLFLNKDEAATALKSEGDSPEGVVGIIAPKNQKEAFFEVICRFENIGYVKDDDAEKIDAGELLKQFKEGTEEQNNERKQAGAAPFYVGDWAEKPRYDKTDHEVIWAITVKDSDAATAPVACVNYNTRILGRRGVLSMNLVSEEAQLATNKKKLGELLDHTKFVTGQSYADYQPGKDKDSGLGIAGLILGGGAMAAAAKLGIFGGLWKFIIGGILILKKFIIIGIVAGAAFLRNLFSKKKKPPSTPLNSGETGDV